MQVQPFTMEELMRQALFSNPWISSTEGLPMGMKPGGSFANWAAKGFKCIQHIWSKDDSDWRLALNLLKTTKSWKINQQRTDLIANIPMKLSQAQEPRPGQWIMLPHAPDAATSTLIFHLTKAIAGGHVVDVYQTKDQSRELIKEGAVELHHYTSQ